MDIRIAQHPGLTPRTVINGARSQTSATPGEDPQARAGNGADPQDFARDNRIQLKHGSLFIDPYLALHPRELDPKNEARLRKKLTLTYTINNPSFFETPERTAVALHLTELIPVSLDAKRSKLMAEVKKFNEAAANGQDPDLIKGINDKLHPFAAIVRDTLKSPETDPVGMEALKNGVATYLLVREKLTNNGYLSQLTDYTPRLMNTDQVLNDLSEKIGATPLEMRAAALKGGIDGVGQLLKIDPRYVADVKALTTHISTRDFGYNMIEHWHIGRQLLGLDAPLEKKISTGLDARITARIDEYRKKVKQHYDIPEPLKSEEKRIAQALELVTPIQRKLMYALGYEICFTPEVTADDIAFHKGIYGLHRKAADDLNAFRGTYRIYFSGKGDLEGSMRTLVHEIAHNLWPNHFTAQEVERIDQLASADTARFHAIGRLIDAHFGEVESLLKAYQAADASGKSAVLTRANVLFGQYGIGADALFPHLRDAHEFQYMVKHAMDTLDVEGERYSRSGYDSPQERFREVISRFAELKQVRYRGEPELLKYLAPGLTEIFDAHYVPHLERVYRDLLKAHPAELPVAEQAASFTGDEPRVIEWRKKEERPGDERRPVAFRSASVSISPHAIAIGKAPGVRELPTSAIRALHAMGITTPAITGV